MQKAVLVTLIATIVNPTISCHYKTIKRRIFMDFNAAIMPLITIVCSVVASGGFWSYLSKHTDKKSASTKMLLGIGHDRIIHLCIKYLERGWITHDELENLHDYLYVPYKELGGNGTAERLMKRVDSLKIMNPIPSQIKKEESK